jgi:hypothetical protein
LLPRLKSASLLLRVDWALIGIVLKWRVSGSPYRAKYFSQFSALTPFFRGISLAQDSRFKSADKKLLAKMKFAPELDQKVDLNKVEISTRSSHKPYHDSMLFFFTHNMSSVSFRVWVAQRITSILGFEDEVVVELVFGHLEVRVEHVFHESRPVRSSMTLLQTPAQQGGHESNINPKDMQIQLTGFLGAEQGMLFMKDLWILLLSAQVRRALRCHFSDDVSHHPSQANCKLSQNEGSKV